MDGVLFTIPDWLDYADFNNYPSEENPTTNADFIDYANNQNILLGALVAAVLWQPNTNFIAGKIIISPNMPEGMEAVALTGGVTGIAEPAWEIDTEEYQDSGVKWKLRYKHWSKDVIPITNGGTGATTAEKARENLGINLKTYTTFEQLGYTTLPNLLDFINNLAPFTKFVRYINQSDAQTLGLPDYGILEITKGQYYDFASLYLQRRGGDNYTRRAYFENWGRGQTSFRWKEIATLDNGVVPVTQGGTGATTAEKARENLGFVVTAIPANSDLNNFTESGKYSCWLVANAQSLANNPMSELETGIILEVVKDNNNVLQIIYGTLVRGMFVRRYGSGSWNNWKNINNGIKIGYLSNSGYMLFENKQVIAWKVATIPETWTEITKPIPFVTNACVCGDRGDSASSPTYQPMMRYDLTTETTDTFIARGGSTNSFYIVWFGYQN